MEETAGYPRCAGGMGQRQKILTEKRDFED